MKKQISALLAALLLAATLAACGDKTPVVTTASAETSDTTSTGEETLGVPETADYGGGAGAFVYRVPSVRHRHHCPNTP